VSKGPEKPDEERSKVRSRKRPPRKRSGNEFKGLAETWNQAVGQLVGRSWETGVNRDGLQLELTLGPEVTAEELERKLKKSLERELARRRRIPKACVFDYQSGAFEGPQSKQPEPSMVFTGYGSTGHPQWEELFQHLLTRGDERVDDVLAHRKRVALLDDRKSLLGNVMEAFGRSRREYSPWWQVNAGYFTLKDQRFTLTYQVIEMPGPQLRGHLIADERLLDAMRESDGRRGQFQGLASLLRRTDRKVILLSEALEQDGSKASRKKLQHEVRKTLMHLVHAIERKGRQSVRRTEHARERQSQNRPVHVFVGDLKKAGVEHFFRDVRKNSLVVLGKERRVHVFSAEGRHITSLRLARKEIDNRIRRERYDGVAPAEVEGIREKCLKMSGQTSPRDSQRSKE